MWQVLQSMLVVAAPPRAVEDAPAPWPAAAEEEDPLNVPGQAVLLPLQPSKLAVYKLFVDQVCQAAAAVAAVAISAFVKYVSCLYC